ncbi:hypothetical protein RR46_03649 [Papilio xuthus]|uniref:Uncharacterized protein n=1 Tax=Papilio xuthus TaxID=66420 RepID=A0A194PYT2_PAPXU|nr:hypothetical protein RR46_03649 [Papilio xuthus]
MGFYLRSFGAVVGPTITVFFNKLSVTDESASAPLMTNHIYPYQPISFDIRTLNRPPPNQLYAMNSQDDFFTPLKYPTRRHLSTNKRFYNPAMSSYSTIFNKMTHLLDYKDMKDIPSLLLYRRYALIGGRQILTRSP